MTRLARRYGSMRHVDKTTHQEGGAFKVGDKVES